MPEHPRQLIASALEALDVRNLVLSIHDPCFPSEPEEDTGRGSPYTRGATRFLEFIRELGFTGIQLGPQGQTSESNASPYDATLFSRNVLNIPLAPLTGEENGGLLPAGRLEALVSSRPVREGPGPRYRYAFRAQRAALDEAWEVLQRARGQGALRPGMREQVRRFEDFARENQDWLLRDALFEALCVEHGQRDWRQWAGREGAAHDARLLAPLPGEDGACEARIKAVRAKHAALFERYAFHQFLVHGAHGQLRERAARGGLKLYGDLQIGFSLEDAWAWQGLFLRTYLMGAPPSRTNPEGQPWNYPVLDPSRFFAPREGLSPEHRAGPVLRFMEARMDKMLGEYDGLRIDHPHGLVCPWVYRADAPDPLRAVQGGARLLDSPALPDHPELARYAIATAAQLDVSVPRHADGWVRTLTPEQVRQYSVLIDTIVTSARRHGRHLTDLLGEVLSTQPYPLQRVLAQYGMGRFRVTQKANLKEPADVYRSENAAPEDWVMVGTHDTPPLWRVAAGWREMGTFREQADYLAWRLHPEAEGREDFARRLREEPGLLEQAKFADLFASRAQNVSIFFADLLGMTEVYNVPGTVNEENWSLRVPADYARAYPEKLGRGAALDLPRVLALALRAGGAPARARHPSLIDALEQRASGGRRP
ncbi:4-alpha-glucanotransferase [Stigmatella aurantiaca]|uniref:4-alpha-glucanotransferase n=1 Tax=Stigmatella aurantiaca (strain DW4/3-1) TaxID=378806 RepID=Q099E8_STIAD|nr:4-alpha-glucanotransferase [Stigmatella aurantiaca]ADO75597.1 4-alpha-glucanotransferase [Stigmatella aurantiaca DW4/3-1]EAU68372.1 putative 4-alpha-glucanotransferase [Stigmatella aurantiaca DW4/3-1]